MSQALPVLSSPPPLPVAGAAPTAAESADSGHSFEAALASQREAGEPSASSEPGRSATGAAPGSAGPGPVNPAPGPAGVAAGGKDLPPELPPDPAAMAVSLLWPGSLSPAANADVPAAAPEAGDLLPGTGDAVADAAVAALAPILLPVANPEPTAPVLEALQDSAATASAVRAAQPLPGAGPATPTAPATTDPLSAIATAVDANAPADNAAERLASLKAVTDAAPELSSVESRATPAPAASFNTLVNLSGTVPNAPNAPTAPAASAQINVPLGHATWGQAFGNQVVWAMNQGLPAAALHLSPPELGPMSIQIRLDNEQASIQFVSAHAVVRDAIEAALPRLRDMLGAQGIVLADVNVSQHGQSGHAQRDPAGLSSAARAAAAPAEDETLAPVAMRSLGVLDVYV